MAAEHHFLQWFGGNALPCSGIFAVATSPEHRSSGLASAAVSQIMREAHDRGDPLTALYPAVSATVPPPWVRDRRHLQQTPGSVGRIAEKTPTGCRRLS